ncbi:MAG: transporter associated domain-containing protein [Methylococcaceae bacterium]|jgi:magnesium and cobalt transporter
MSDDYPPSTPQKSWLEKISHLLTSDPQDVDDLLDVLREAKARNVLDTDALSMIEGVLQVSQMRVRDIMIPRVQMTILSKDASLESILSIVTESGHSRYPVIDGDKSKVIGVLLTKDLLARVFENKNLTVQDIMRSVSIVPESKRLNVLLKESRTNGNHMTIVVDEYGQTAGLVTIEDVLEQIVGDIEDEHDDPDDENYVFQRSESEYMLKALMPIDDFDEYFGTQLATDEYDTIGGFVVSQLEHMPHKGENLVVDNFKFEVIKADNRRIYLIKLIQLK